MLNKTKLMYQSLQGTYSSNLPSGILYKPKVQKDIKKDLSSKNKINTIAENDFSNVNFDPETEQAISSISKHFEVPEQDIRKVFALESSGKYNALNNNKTAAGLIQFFADNPKDSFENRYKTIGNNKYYLKDIAKMTPNQQVPLIIDYLQGAGFKKGGNFDDLYLSIFYPAARNKEDNFILGSERSSKLRNYNSRMNAIAKQNRHYDSDYMADSKNNYLTKLEVKEGVRKYLDRFKTNFNKRNKNRILYNKN